MQNHKNLMNINGADYEWGMAVKYECIHTYLYGAVNICKARQGGI